MIRPAATIDAKALCNIYNYYVSNTFVTFDENPVTEEEMAEKVAAITRKFPWIVGVEGEEIVGYAYAGEWKSRCSYRNTVESTVYIKESHKGKGMGSRLYTTLIQQLKMQDMHAVIGGISLPNAASVGLHEKMGFIKVAHFREVGYKFDQWIDVGYWQLLLR